MIDVSEVFCQSFEIDMQKFVYHRITIHIISYHIIYTLHEITLYYLKYYNKSII